MFVLAQTQIAGGGAKPSSPFKSWHMWQARSICLIQHKTKQRVCETCFLWDLSLSKVNNQQSKNTLKISTSSINNVPSRVKTGDVPNKTIQFQLMNNVWIRSKFQVPPPEKIPSRKNRHACLANETICNPIVQEYSDKLKIPQVPQQEISIFDKTGSFPTF